ncbi:MAG: hypothetical protein ACM3S1_07475 [Hyphomicrobiales bacterium]
MTAPAGSRDPIVVAEALDPVQAGIWVDALRAAGIEAGTYERSVSAAFGGAAIGGASYPVLVDSGNLGAARTVIAELSGGAVLAPYRDSAAQRERRTQALRVVLGVVVVALVMALILRFAA